MSAGGLVSALMGVHNFRATWIGWPGATAALLRWTLDWTLDWTGVSRKQ